MRRSRRDWRAYILSYLYLPAWLLKTHTRAVMAFVAVVVVAAAVVASPMTAVSLVLGEETASGMEAAFEDSNELNETEIRFQVHERVNEIRVENGRDPLPYSTSIARRAQEHSEWMANQSQLSHSKDGHYQCLRSGENIAYTLPRGNVRTEHGVTNYYANETRIAHGIVDQWVHSEGHRKNMLDRDWVAEGIGVSTGYSEDGTLVYVTQGFCGDAA